MSAGVYLTAYLAPLAPWLSRPEVTDSQGASGARYAVR